MPGIVLVMEDKAINKYNKTFSLSLSLHGVQSLDLGLQIQMSAGTRLVI